MGLGLAASKVVAQKGANLSIVDYNEEALEKAKLNWEEDSKNKRFPINEEHIAEVISMMTGIPVKRMVEAETTKLRKMAEDMRGQVIGQEDAIGKVVKAIQRNRVGLKDPKKPIGTFIFLARRNLLKIPRFQSIELKGWPTLDALIILLAEIVLVSFIFMMNSADVALHQESYQFLRPY